MRPTLFKPAGPEFAARLRKPRREANVIASALEGKQRDFYLTDLTDEQWELIRSQVFPAAPLADELRDLVNAFRYRERALCPWRLFPPGFASLERLDTVWNQWNADGTWTAIRTILGNREEPRIAREPGAVNDRSLRERLGSWAIGRFLIRMADRIAPVLKTARRRIAAALKRVPGGGILLAPGHAAIQAVEFLLSRFTIHARFPRWFRRGQWHFFRQEYAKAIDFYSRIIDCDPRAGASSYLNRARCLHQLRQYREACADARRALAAPNVSREDRIGTYFLLSEAVSLSGEIDRGIDFGFHARWLERQGPAPELEDQTPLLGPDTFEILAETHNDLAELAINANTDFETATRIYQNNDELRERYLHWLGEVAPRTLFLPDDWVRNIGHIALLEYWVKMKQMGWGDWERMVLLAPPKRTANAAYLRYFRRFFHIVQNDPASAGVSHFASCLGRRLACLMPLPDGTAPYLPEAIGAIQEEWERQGRQPLFRLTAEDDAFGREQLRLMGVPKGAWFVCFHVRSSGFYREGKILHQAHRNARIRSYLPAMREVVRRGGWVIRLGDPSMEPLPRLEGAIDYARSKFKSERMDVFLGAAAKCFVGVTSGLYHVPFSFGVPCVLTNWVSNMLPIYSPTDRFIPKLLRRDADGHTLTFEEWLSRPVRESSYSGEGLIRDGYSAVDNTAEEITEVVAEMLDRMEGGTEESAASRMRAAQIAKLAAKHGIRGFAPFGSGFLARHSDLLESPVESAID